MAKLEPEVQGLIDELKSRNDIPAGALSAIQSTVESSPYLANAMAEAVRSGSLKHLDFMSDAHKAGDYDGKGTIHLEVGNFDPALRKPGQLKDNLAVVLGHETGHALMADASNRELYLLDGGISKALQQSVRTALADGQQTTHPVNLTPQVSRYLEASRSNEGLAELVGMNALASRASNGAAGQFNREDFLKRVDPSTPCVDPNQNGLPTLEQNIVLGKAGIQMTGGKIESPAVDRVARCFFDEGVGLGPKGQSSYRDYYGADALERVSEIWNKQADATTTTLSPPQLNLSDLKLDPDTVSKAGIDLGAKGKTFEFYDTSHGGLAIETVKQLYQTPPQKGARRMTMGGGSDEVQVDEPRKPLADEPASPAFNDFERIRLTALGNGRWNEEESKAIAASLLKAHTEDPVSKRMDQCVVAGPTAKGEVNVFAVYSPHGDKGPHFTTRVNGDQAAQEPVKPNLEQVEQVRQQQAQELIQQQTQQVNNPTQRGPSLSL